MLYPITTLANGIRIVSESVPYVQSVAIGIWIDTGARDETDRQAGICHFLEHRLYKGTQRRSARQLAEELDAIGGQLNAFTEKEHTCFYAKVLPEHTEIALDVIADMLQHSVVDPEELARERNVILEEIKQHEDTPEELVHDVFTQTLWPAHPLGRPVLGDPAVIAAVTREEVLDYVRRQYAPGRMVIAAAGNLEHGRLVELAGGLFGAMSGNNASRSESRPEPRRSQVEVNRPVEQVHFCFGSQGCGQHDEDRYALGVLDTAVGGGMSSRLFQEVREKRGLCYTIGSYTAAFRDGGLFAVYGGTSPENLEEVRELSRQELAAVARDGLTDAELERAKNQIRGGVLLGLDSMSGRMTRLGKSLLYYDRVVTAAEVVERVSGVTLADTRQVAARVFGEGEFAGAAIGPLNGEDE